MSKLAVIVAGGSGLRMGNELPKQFLLLAPTRRVYVFRTGMRPGRSRQQ